MHTFAWNGLSFDLPADWNLASFVDDGKALRIRMEDDVSIRLELEWTISSRKINPERMRTQYERLTRSLSDQTISADQFTGLAAGWSAVLYTMHDRRRFITAMFLDQPRKLIAVFKLHFEAGSRRDPARLLDLIIASLVFRDQGILPWRVYDVAFDLSHEWRLVRTSFLAGRKFFVFEWRLRRLYVWFISLADLALKDRALSDWSADFLNQNKQIKGPVFYTDGARIKARRHGGFRFGHFEEIGRATLQYEIRSRHDTAANHIRLAVMNYRNPSDLRLFPEQF